MYTGFRTSATFVGRSRRPYDLSGTYRPGRPMRGERLKSEHTYLAFPEKFDRIPKKTANVNYTSAQFHIFPFWKKSAKIQNTTKKVNTPFFFSFLSADIENLLENMNY